MHTVVDHPGGRMPLEYLVDSPQFFRQPDVVRIQQRDHFAARALETEIERRGLPAIRLSQVTNRLSEFPQSFLRAVSLTVVHSHNFPLPTPKLLPPRPRNIYVAQF